jgi:hypothetical protein
MAKDPKACPFDHPVESGSAIEAINDHFHGVCKDCGAQGPERDSYAAALVAWNSRRREQRH